MSDKIMIRPVMGEGAEMGDLLINGSLVDGVSTQRTAEVSFL